MKLVTIPSVDDGPPGVCWKQPDMIESVTHPERFTDPMEHCTKKAGHTDRHTWEKA